MNGYLVARKDDICSVMDKQVLVSEAQVRTYITLYIEKVYGKKISEPEVDLKQRSVRFYVDNFNDGSYDVPAIYWLIKVNINI